MEKLRSSFQAGPILNDQGRRLLEEHSVAQLQGLKIEIFSKEHPPPHFRVSYSGETNNFTIDDCSPMNGNSLKKWFRNIRKCMKMRKMNLSEFGTKRGRPIARSARSKLAKPKGTNKAVKADWRFTFKVQSS
jgi:hypothetical protein